LFGVKILKFYDADPGWKKFGSGIGKNFPDSQHRVNIAVDPLQLGERYCLLNSLGEEDVILDRVSHYAEPNIKVSSMLEQGFPLRRAKHQG
jgi:hypothetical protein